jgi:hypothetical protein
MVCLVNAKADRPGLTAGWVEMIDAVPCRGRRFSLEVTHSTRTPYANTGSVLMTRVRPRSRGGAGGGLWITHPESREVASKRGARG